MKSIKLSKILILFALVFVMIATPVCDFVIPAFASEVVEEDNQIINSEAVNIGVNRKDTLETNQELFNDNLMGVAKIIFAFMVFVAVILIGIKAITESYDGKSRAQIIEKFKHIIYGVILFSVATLIVAIASQFQETILSDLYSAEYTEITSPVDNTEDLDTNWLANIIEMGLKVIGRLIEAVLEFLFGLISGNGLDNAIDNQYTLNNVLFLADFGNTIDINAENAYGVKLSTAPFTTAEWSRYTKAYLFLATIAVPLMLLSVLKVAFDLVSNAGNFEKVAEAKKTVMRILSGIIIIALGPYLFRTVLTFFNMLVFLIPVEFSFDIVIECIDDANGLLAVVTSLWWLWIKLRITLLFVVREIMLTVMYIITPVVIGFWTISEKTKAFNKWIGETVTNAATQFCYAIVFFIATVVLSGAQTNAFFTLLWLSMMLKLADFFKESFQNLFDKWSGINELQVSDSMLGKADGFAKKITNTTLDKVDENKINPFVRGMSNFMAFTDFTQTGNTSSFVTEKAAIAKQAKADKGDAVDRYTTAKKLRDNDFFKELVKAPEGVPFDQWSDTAKLNKFFMDGNDAGVTSILEYYNNPANAANDPDFAKHRKDVFDVFDINKEFEESSADIIKYTRLSNFAKDDRKGDLDKVVGKVLKGRIMERFEDRYAETYQKQTEARVQKYLATQANAPLSTKAKIKSADLELTEEMIRKQMMIDGFNPDRSANKNYMSERQTSIGNVVAPTARALSTADTAIRNQTKGKSLVTEDIQKQNVTKTNEAVKGALDSTIALYKTAGKPIEGKMKKMLEEYADVLGANGLSDLQEKYISQIEDTLKPKKD